ncbi:hypothetical protein JIN84_01380 [Luteolibacter yonseiensis]|uniref:Uncharacterized protein n=1 Tax=Luteolibacter yonseiensis TaxID=1144680 RepID=A0A934R028_9BACT|nr:hypothetical protein [Luteolibacter yonseiensis]MBK1814259.1 hypothetical protein [Luteolibacter yonseiensis]
MTVGIQAPEKELRFTRSGQAIVFSITAAVLTAVGVTLLASAWYRDINPLLPHPAWALVPFAFAIFMAHTAVRLTKHAYLILTPLGIEIFPFFRPADGMRLVTWQEIHTAEVDGRTKRLTLHHDAGKTSGIHLSLSPIRADRRTLLAKAVLGRVSPPGNNG